MTEPGATKAQMDHSANQLLSLAQRALAVGICVLPPKEDGTKAPLTRVLTYDGESHTVWATTQLLNGTPATVSPGDALLRSWYGPRTGIGAVCGAVSHNLELIESDDAKTFEDFLAAADATGLGVVHALRAGYEEATPGGGIHWLYRCEQIAGSEKLARRPEPTAENPHAVKTLIETKGEGGYVILAPSNGKVHPTGGRYRLVSGDLGLLPTITPEERAELLRLARTFDEMPAQMPRRSQVHDSAAAAGERPGDAFNQRTTWDGVLVPHGWEAVHECAGVRYWRRPGKGRGISATTNATGSDTLIVFSSSTPLETVPTSYDRFGAYAVLNHEGDFSAAARELSRQGYGSPMIPIQNDRPAIVSPTRNDAREWPALPGEEAFSGLAGEVVRRIDPHTEADPVAVLVQFLLAFANVVGSGPHAQVGATRHSIRENAVLVGPTAKARKGESWSPVRYLFAMCAPEWASNCVKDGLSSGEGLIWAVRDPLTKHMPIKEKGRTVGYEDVIDDPGIDDKRLFVLEPEFGRLLRVMTRQANTLSAVIRQAWETGDLRIMTKTSPAKATGAHISIVGHVTGEELSRELTDTETVNGFANRFLWLAVKRSKLLPEPEPLDAEDMGDLIDTLVKRVYSAQHPGCLDRDGDARDLWASVYGDLSADRPGLAGAVLARAEAHVLRLSLIYALLDGASMVGVSHLRSALELWSYVEESVTYIFGDLTGNPVADTVLQAARQNGELTRTQISDLLGRHESSARIAQGLQLLLTTGKARVDTHQSGGRPVEVWRAT